MKMPEFEKYAEINAVTGVAAYRRRLEDGRIVWQCYAEIFNEGMNQPKGDYLKNPVGERKGFETADAVINALLARGYRGMVRFLIECEENQK